METQHTHKQSYLTQLKALGQTLKQKDPNAPKKEKRLKPKDLFEKNKK
jgi:hypothetical protein|tara:strand:+ start:264 stop:407 length:144 start_codon:yes stop_codon:yes gene_type:complete